MNTYIILNDSTKKIRHWNILNPNKTDNIKSFTHPNYLIEQIEEDSSFIEKYNSADTVFLVDNLFANRKLLHSKQMDLIKRTFPKSRFFVSSGLFDEGEDVEGYDGSVGSMPLKIEDLEKKIKSLVVKNV